MDKLYRSNRTIGGVCGGLGEYFNVDSLLFKILFIAGFFIPPIPAILIYIIFWIIIPKKPEINE